MNILEHGNYNKARIWMRVRMWTCRAAMQDANWMNHMLESLICYTFLCSPIGKASVDFYNGTNDNKFYV